MRISFRKMTLAIAGVFAAASGGRIFGVAGLAPTGGMGGARALPPGRRLLVTLAPAQPQLAAGSQRR